MIPHTNAFKRLKDEIQKVLDFAIVVAYAVPNLKNTLKNLPEGSSLSFSPDYFDRPTSTAKVREHAKEYKEVLSRYIFLSSFSFFEAYFLDLIKEIITFHGSDELLQKHCLEKNKKVMTAETIAWKRKLQERRIKKNDAAYSIYGAKLAAKGFVFPSSILARRGLELLLLQFDGDYIKAVDIPDLVESVLQMKLDEELERKEFHKYRDMRNKIAHGRPDAISLNLKKAIEMNNFLRNLALKIDKHVLENLLLVEL